MHFVLFQSSKNSQWYWQLRAANHEPIADGAEGYVHRQGALHGIELVKSVTGGTATWDDSTRSWL